MKTQRVIHEGVKLKFNVLSYNESMKNEIKAYSHAGIEDLLVSMKQPRFRSKQIVKWLYQQGVTSYDDMTNLPLELRKQLEIDAPLYVAQLINKQISSDGTRKYVWEFHDGCRVETVAIPSRTETDDGGPKRLTVCFSTQVGCAMACEFCATGREGFTRNLLPGEMIDQVILAGKDMRCRVTNVVAMGQGEGFLNYENTLAALRFLNDSDGLAIGARHITVSTCGILKGINKISTEPEQFTLAISLHSAIQATRDRLMPKVSHESLPLLRAALIKYTQVSNRRVTLEYLLINKVNDKPEDLVALKQFCKNLLCHVNILPVNEISGSPYLPSPPKTMRHWITDLNAAGIETTLRDSRGSDIDGACGQLKNATN